MSLITEDVQKLYIKLRKTLQLELSDERCSFIIADATKLPFRNGYFDIVVSPSVIEHIPHQEEAISEIERVCARNGKVVISTDNNYGKYASLSLNTFMALGGKVLRMFGILPKNRIYFIKNTPSEFRNKIRAVSLDVEHFEFTHFSVPFRDSIFGLIRFLPHFFQNCLLNILSFLERESRMSKTGFLHPVFIVVARKR
jgi:ubiquinone/menaquinone biosynthesis C-methylase UbiE